MSLSKLKGLVVAVAAGASTLVLGVSSAWATTPPGAYLWPGNAPGGTTATVVAVIAVASTAVLAAVYGVFTLRARPVSAELGEVREIGTSSRASSDQRKAA